MKVSASREHLLEALQSVIGVVERRQTMPILSNILLSARDNRLRATGTDLEVELVAAAEVTVQQPGDITVPGRKLLDIVRNLPEKSQVTLTREGSASCCAADAAASRSRVFLPRNFRSSMRSTPPRPSRSVRRTAGG